MEGPVDIAIVGGGAAGIGAARRLAGSGRSVLLIEARDRLGGRGWTQDTTYGPLDLGCGWLHSADRNPWVEIAHDLGIGIDKTPPQWREQYRSLGFAPGEEAAAAAAFAGFGDRLRNDPPASDRASDALQPGDRWNAWLDALSGYINGAGLDALSVADYLAYDDAASDCNWRAPEGYGALIAAASPSAIRIEAETIVKSVDHAGPWIRIETDRGTTGAMSAIVTVPGAVLAAGAIRFEPAIDPWLHAASLLPLGLADKLFLSIGGAHDLPADAHLIGSTRSAATGSYTLCPFGRPLIECFFGGNGADALERDGPDAMAAFATDELSALLGGEWRRRLRPIAGSRWRRDPFARGSYSHAAPGHAEARAALAAPVSDRLIFAGEACSAHDFSTAHGAFASGEAAADHILNRLT